MKEGLGFCRLGKPLRLNLSLRAGGMEESREEGY
jgi:hypothetical protein